MSRFYTIIAFLATLSFCVSSCGDDDEEDVGGEGKYEGTISGVAQKGQFLRGSSVTIYALDKNLDATGLSYPTQTTDDLGSFTVSNVNASYIDVKANGYYYNENRCETSNSTINLQAVAAIGSNINVNLLTTLAYNRIKYLVKTGLSFADAQNRAQIEVLTALGLGNSTTTNFTNMNIAGSGDANGLLLAASLLIQQDRSVGDVSKLISDIAADMEDDGILSSDLNSEIHRYEHHIYVGDVIRGLLDFYEKNKVENFSIPTFYKFLDTNRDGKPDGQDEIFMNIGASEVSLYNPMDMNRGYDSSGFSHTILILSTIPFNVKSDAEWLTIEKKTIAENIYAINLVAPANTGDNRTAHVLFSDNSGKELANYTYQQKSPENLVPQRLIFYYSYNQYNEIAHLMPNVVGVNGKTYNAVKTYGEHYHGLGDYWYVDVPYSDKKDQYQLYFPISMVSMPDGYGGFRVTIPKSITSDEFPFVSLLDNPYYSAHYYPQNPADVRLLSACASVYVYDINTIDHIILSANKPIWGSADYSINDGSVNIDYPTINQQETHADNDGKYRMTVQVNHHDGLGECMIPILQSGVLVHVECYDSANSLLNQYDAYSGYYLHSSVTR